MSALPFDIAAVRAQFPGLQREIGGKPLVYLDSANTAQKFASAIAASNHYYQAGSANVFRAVHTLGEEATAAFEGARDQVRLLLNAPERAEIIFTKGTTEALNLLAYSYGALLKSGDAIVLTEMEHHANIVPWQLLAKRSNLTIKVLPITDAGELDLSQLDALLTPEVKLFCFTHVSNVLGTINPVQQLCQIAKSRGIITVIDGSQAAPHLAIDVQAIGCDFYAFTGHKLYAPTGTGVLWGRRALLERMPPFLGGGDMIEQVSFSGSTFAELPNRFEAGTPNIAGAIGLGAAIASTRAFGLDAICAREHELAHYAQQALEQLEGLRLMGHAAHRAPVFSFTIDGTHPHDVATLLDQRGIAIRSGQHCAHPLMARMGVSASARASLAFYNTKSEVDALVEGLYAVRKLLT
jgi:cysteine desulfurase / selenocysteine lyase